MSIESAGREVLARLEAEGRLRAVPPEADGALIDLCSNDYLGLAARADEFLPELDALRGRDMSASASRLLAARQRETASLEAFLTDLYGRPALLFNSGYHANTGVIAALAALPGTLIIADRLSHASTIDGLMLTRTKSERFPHNDIARLRALLEKYSPEYANIVVAVESIYSMDGDRAPLRELVALKGEFPGMAILLDEAHGLGCYGPRGLGLAEELGLEADIDIIMCTLGKAAASAGAFVVAAPDVVDYLLNTARSFIFSTALPPLCARWSELMMRHIVGMQSERDHLRRLAARLADGLRAIGLPAQEEPSHIQPIVAGSAEAAMRLAAWLRSCGIMALPIRRPTVPAGTERVRLSLSAALSEADIDQVINALKSYRP